MGVRGDVKGCVLEVCEVVLLSEHVSSLPGRWRRCVVEMVLEGDDKIY